MPIKKVVKKAVVKKPIKKAVKAPKLVGVISHYFDNISVAVVKLSDVLKVGDNIRIEGGENTDFKQSVKSMEVEHKKIIKAKKGQEAGLKIKERAREGYKVYKV